MKKHILLTLLILVMFACHENLVDKTQEFSKKTGDEISRSEAERWISRFSNLQVGSRLQDFTYSISSENLDIMLLTENLTGIAFHHSYDEQGFHHILAIPLDNTLSLWQPTKNVFDATTNEEISLNVAERWAKNYNEKHPNDIAYHRFGSDIFSEIKQLSYFKSFDIEAGINDSEQPQLILVVRNQSTNGRIKIDQISYFDKSDPVNTNP